MRAFWSDPYLWVHLAGLAMAPIFLELCLIGFTIGNPFLPGWMEWLLVALVGIAPILWMQWQRPFYIFSLPAVVVKPDRLTEDQRRLLTQFKATRNRLAAVAVAVVLLLLLRQIYFSSAIAAEAVAFSGSRFWGLLLAAGAFLASNLFIQVPISVAAVMLTRSSEFAKTRPFPPEQVTANFSLLGIPLNQVLPPIVPEPPKRVAPTQSTLIDQKVTALVETAETTEDGLSGWESDATPSIATPEPAPRDDLAPIQNFEASVLDGADVRLDASFPDTSPIEDDRPSSAEEPFSKGEIASEADVLDNAVSDAEGVDSAFALSENGATVDMADSGFASTSNPASDDPAEQTETIEQVTPEAASDPENPQGDAPVGDPWD